MKGFPLKTPLLATALVFLGGVSTTFAADQADQILRGMSAKLAAAKHFTFEATREVDATLRDGYSVPEKARVHVAVSRPNQFAARSVSRQGTRRIIADGRQLTVVDEKPHHYAQVPMHATIDQFVDKLDTIYGFTPPLADFALSDVYRDLRRQARQISYLGTAKVGGAFGMGGEECHRIALAGRAADAELWVAVSDQLPRKLIATFRLTGQPQLRITFSSWNLHVMMKALPSFSLPGLLTAALLALTTPGPARDFGVSTSPKGRGTKIETERGRSPASAASVRLHPHRARWLPSGGI